MNLRGSNRRNLQIVRNRSLLSARKREEGTRGWKHYTGRLLKLTRTIYFVLGILIGIAINALSIPKSLVEFASNFGEARQYVYDFVYSPSNWSGIFDTFPEGIVNMLDIEITSPVQAALEIEVVDGNRLDGRIWWIGSCDMGGLYQGLLIDGRISIGGSTAEVEVLDFIGGRQITFFQGQLNNDGLVVEFENFPVRSGLNGSRIVRNPEPATNENWGDLYCD